MIKKFKLWESLYEAKKSKDSIIKKVKDSVSDLYHIPDFQVIQRPDEPEQIVDLFSDHDGHSFALNFTDSDELYSIDFWLPKSLKAESTLYLKGQDLDLIIKNLPKLMKDPKPKEAELKEAVTGIFNPENTDVGHNHVELKKPAKTVEKSTNPKVNAVDKGIEEYKFGNPDTMFDDFRKYLRLVIKGVQPALLITGQPGLGKCHRKGDRILMHDLSIKNVEDIIKGDFLMGDDSLPREVLSLARGRDQMFEIKPTKGDSIFVNGDHILCLVNTSTGKIVERSVYDYLMDSKQSKIRYKLYHVGVDFDSQPINIDPYWLGLWLGDGSSHTAALTIADKDNEILDFHKEYCESLDLIVHDIKSKEKYSCNLYTPVANDYNKIRIAPSKINKNILLEKLRAYNLSGSIGSGQRKRIPKEYLINDRETRLQLLAGLIDSDGGMYGSGCYGITSKWETFADDIAILARSLGYLVTRRYEKKSIKKIGFIGYYYTVVISGAHDIPCRLPRKQSSKRKQIKNVLRTGFKIIPIGEDNYYGFTITGNGRYLMHDFLVTHNTFISMDEINKAGLVKGEDWVKVKGKTTAAAVYISLYRNNGKLLIYDDCDSIFKDENAVNVLKGALDSQQSERDISWDSAKEIKDPSNGEVIPKSFNFTGRVIFLSNLPQNKIDDAIKSRAFVYEMALTPEDMVEYIKKMLPKVMPDEPMSIKKGAMNAIKNIAANNKKVKLNMRTVEKAIKILKNIDSVEDALRMIGQQCEYS